jgi:hypothetical protein
MGAYDPNIVGCTSDVVNVSAWDAPVCTAVDPSIGCLGVKTGGTGQNNAASVDAFINGSSGQGNIPASPPHDPSAYWTDGDGAAGWQTGVIHTNEAPSSRIVPVAVFSVPEYLGTGCSGSNCMIRILKIVGFFLEGTCDQNTFVKESYLQCPSGGSAKAAVVGRLVNYIATGPVGPNTGGFGKILTLVR